MRCLPVYAPELHGARLLFTGAVAVLAVAAVVPVAQPRRSPDYVRDVRPILKAHCYQCHGPDGQQGGLRLDVRRQALRGGASGPAIIPHDSARSPLLRRILGLDGKPRMPMGFAPLQRADVATLRAWIDAGANWPLNAEAPHWAYIAPKRPRLPAIRERAWVRNPIDQFILARLEARKLSPSREADRATLIRRVSLDLTGLPPTPAEVDAFVADVRPGAYERVVDRLLASPHYGERMAERWLDLARYADSNGYEKDERRSIWPYRDWVIRAYNADMPFTDFTVRQIAGDLLPNATVDDRVATGFHRNTMLNEEGGVDKGEQRWLTDVDRVGTTGVVWLGTTLGCTECHDHKYDPFTQREFYGMMAFFEHADEPTLSLPTPAQTAQQSQLEAEQKQAQAMLDVKPAPPPATAAKLKAEVADTARRLDALDIPTTLVFAERQDGKPLVARIRVKGAYTSPSDTVPASTPAVLNPWPAGAPHNRLGLAEWIASPANPLTARVAVNRLWEHVFGKGIVETSEDFGTQGAKPTHPALLDWLATEFVRRGWSQKQMLRLMVTSATYRQSANCSASQLAADPKDDLLGRAPRFREDAETLRDMALTAAGLLDPKVGGPSVFPSQPDGVWDLPYNGDTWAESSGGDQYRRGLYTFWRRSAPYPAFVAYDATSREYCTVRRVRTTTPLQALVSLNDPAFFVAAQALARRMAGAPPAGQIDVGFRLCTSRRPTQAQRARLQRLVALEHRRFAADPARAAQVCGEAKPGPDSADLAALTVAANVMLNMDEALTRS